MKFVRTRNIPYLDGKVGIINKLISGNPLMFIRNRNLTNETSKKKSIFLRIKLRMRGGNFDPSRSRL